MMKMTIVEKKERQEFMKDNKWYNRQIDGDWGNYSKESTGLFQKYAQSKGKYYGKIDTVWCSLTEKAYQALKIKESNVSNSVDYVDKVIFKNMIKQASSNPNKVFINNTGLFVNMSH